MTYLRVLANVFKPGNAEHMIRKNVNWHPQGITNVKHFTIEPCAALPERKLKKKPKSLIRDYNLVEASPYTIPQPPNHFDDEWIYLRNIAEKDSQNVLAYPVDVEHLMPLDWKKYSNKEPLPKINSVKGEWRMWCE